MFYFLVFASIMQFVCSGEGRTGSRDGKKIRQSSDLNLDNEDDPDLSMR